MEKLWLNSYEQGVNAEIDITQYSSISDVFRQSVEKFAHQPAFQNMGKTLTYAEVGKLAENFASYLQNVLKLPRGERVAIMLPNLLQYPIALFGILQAGLVAVNTNPLYTPRELEHQLKDSGATTITFWKILPTRWSWCCRARKSNTSSSLLSEKCSASSKAH